MAVQIDPPGQIQEFLDILKRRKWQVLLPTIVLVSLGIFLAVVIPKKYLVTTQIELREIFLGEGLDKAAQQQAQGIAENAPQQILSLKRITEVLETLKWPDYLTLSKVDKVEYRENIHDNITATVPRKLKQVGSAFVTIDYRNVNKDRAQQFLKALRKAWIEQVVERQRTRYDVEYRKLLERRSELEKDYLKETRLLSDLRSENNISPTQPTPGANQQRVEDPTVSRFEANTSRMEAVSGELTAAEETLLLIQKQLAETEPEIPKTRVIEGLSFATQIEEARLLQGTKERQLDGIRPAHPRYKMIQRELDLLDVQIRELEMRQTSSEVSQEFEPNPAYIEFKEMAARLELGIGTLAAEKKGLIGAIEQNHRDMRRLNEAYREDSEHSSRIEVIMVALQELEIDLVRKKQRRDVVYGDTGNPFQIIQEVEDPGSPTEPNPYLIIGISLVLGLIIGFGTLIVAEFSKDCFKNTADINRVLVAPVLGVIAPIVTRIDRRRRRFKSLFVASLSLLLVSLVLFVTWAWSYEPDLLGVRLNDSIENFRTLFL